MPTPETARSRVMQKIVKAQNRERVKVLQELGSIRGFMPLLMKKRNGQGWNLSEREALLLQLRGMAHVSPYLVVLFLPGSFVLVPVLAWWLDRRRQEREKRQIN